MPGNLGPIDHELEDLLADPDTGMVSDDEVSEIDPFGDSEESVDRYLRGEFSSAIEAEEKEAAIEYLLSRTPFLLKSFGLKDPSAIDRESIDELMGYGFEDIHEIENLYFHVWDMVREEFGPFYAVKFQYMTEIAENLDSDLLTKKQNDESIDALITMGVDSDSLLDSRGKPQERRNMRRLNWLLQNEPSLAELVSALKNSKEHGMSVMPHTLAIHTKDYLIKVNESLKSMDLEKMNSIDRAKHGAQSQLIKHHIAIAESIVQTIE